MKIKKEKKIILEAVELKEDAANELQKELDKVPETGEVELDDASTKEVAADIQQSAEEAGKEPRHGDPQGRASRTPLPQRLLCRRKPRNHHLQADGSSRCRRCMG